MPLRLTGALAGCNFSTAKPPSQSSQPRSKARNKQGSQTCGLMIPRGLGFSCFEPTLVLWEVALSRLEGCGHAVSPSPVPGPFHLLAISDLWHAAASDVMAVESRGTQRGSNSWRSPDTTEQHSGFTTCPGTWVTSPTYPSMSTLHCRPWWAHRVGISLAIPHESEAWTGQVLGWGPASCSPSSALLLFSSLGHCLKASSGWK